MYGSEIRWRLRSFLGGISMVLSDFLEEMSW